MTAASALPPLIAEEVLRRYADVLRVGRLRVNGDPVQWNTDTSTELQLGFFSAAFFAKLRRLPEVQGLSDAVLRLASYWFCKAVSINYALIEVLLLVKQKVGALCTIETREEGGGGLVDYHVRVSQHKPPVAEAPADARLAMVGEAAGPPVVQSTHLMQITLTWRGKDNLVYRDPNTAEKKVKGTLSRLETEFSLPPEHGLTPEYQLQMKLRRTLAARIVSKAACGGRKARIRNGTETLLPEGPLLSYPASSCSSRPDEQHPCEMVDLAALDVSPPPTLATTKSMSSTSIASTDSACSPLPTMPLSFSAHTVRVPPRQLSLVSPSLSHAAGGDAAREGAADNMDAPVGHLRVRIVRATDLASARRGRATTMRGCVSVLGLDVMCEREQSDAYARCSVARETRQTRTIANCPNPEWCEAWDFLVWDRDLRGEVVVEVFDEDARGPGNNDLLLGSVHVPVSVVLGNSGKAVVARRLTDGASARARGSLRLELELVPVPTTSSGGAASSDDDEGGLEESGEEDGADGPECIGAACSAKHWVGLPA